MKSIAFHGMSLLLGFFAIACQAADPASNSSRPVKELPAAPAKVEIPTTGVHSITLPTYDVQMPGGPGQMTYVSACMLCHSPRYVLIQPSFSKKKWTEEVEKMKKTYGAPIQDEQVEPIVKYLCAIRGNGQ